MTRIQERHRLGALLEGGVDPSEPEGLLGLLAAYQVSTDARLRAGAVELLRAGLPSSDELDEYRKVALATAPPPDWCGEEAWIRSIETLGLAAQAAEELHDALGEVLVVRINATTVEAMLAFDERVWTNPLVAEQSRQGPLPDVIPWAQIESGVASQALRAGGAVRSEILDAWLEDRLHVEDAAALREWVCEPGPWREAYRSRIAELSSWAGVPRLDLQRSISVAADDSELPFARIIQDVPLPHLGPRARREGRLHARGTLWRLRDAKSDRRLLVPYGAERLEWEDPSLGTVVTELRALPVDDLGLAEDAMSSIVKLADGAEHPRARQIALSVTNDLRAGALHDGVASAAHALDHGNLEADRELKWVACALRTYVELERLGHRLDDGELDRALAAANESVLPHASALMLLEEDEYRDLVRDYDIDSNAWAGARQRLDEDVPTAYVVEALGSLALDAPSGRGGVVSLAGYRAAVEHDLELRAAEGSGIQYDARAAAASARSPGDVDLLVTVGSAERVGRVLRVSVKLGSKGAFDQCEWFAPLARDAIRDAYAAAGAACPEGLPPHPLEEHRIIVHEPKKLSVIDGSSLGLPLVLAFASLWLGKAVAEDLAATGRLMPSAQGWRVQGVADVAAKAAGLYARAGKRASRVMAPPEHEAEIRAFDHEPISVTSVADALKSAELELMASDLVGAWPDRRSRLRALHELVEAVETQEVRSLEVWGDPWRIIGDRIAALVAALADGTADADAVARGRVFGALAYIHAGDPKAAGRLVARGVDDEALPGAALVRQIVELDRAIDEADWESCLQLRDRLEQSLRVAPERELAMLAGQAWGTMGRSLLHERQPEFAIPLLEKAMDHHAEHCPHETGRSRVYLAAALRGAGRIGDAAEELARAETELDQHTKPWSVEYNRQCRAYLLYERARNEIARDNPEPAIADCEAAYEIVRRQGFWPALGILRTLAWAYRLNRNADEADRCVELIEALEVPDAHRRLRDRILEEAEGLPVVVDGEVY